MKRDNLWNPDLIDTSDLVDVDSLYASPVRRNEVVLTEREQRAIFQDLSHCKQWPIPGAVRSDRIPDPDAPPPVRTQPRPQGKIPTERLRAA
jgi:hypothetical protein